MSTFDCPRCSKVFAQKRPWVYHLKHLHRLAPLPVDPTTVSPSQATISGPNIPILSTPPADDETPAIGRFKVGPKVSFKVAYDLGRGDEAQPIQVTISKDESYDKFLGRLQNVFYGAYFERSLRQWEYVLVNRHYERGDPLPLTSSNTYYAMVSELLRPKSRWRHAVVRRSHSENPIIRAVAKGTCNTKRDSPLINSAALNTSLPNNQPIPNVFQPGVSIIGTPPVANASQPDDSIADTPMPDAPMDQATSELLTSTPPSRAWVVTSASATPSSRIPSLGLKSHQPSTPLTPVAGGQGRWPLQLSSPLAHTARARGLMQPYVPLISSPLAPEGGRRSMRFSSPIALFTNVPRPSQLSPPLAPVVSTQARQRESESPLKPSAIAQCSARLLSSTTSPAAGVQNPSSQLSSKSATAAIAQDPAIRLGSITSPAAGAPSPPIQLGLPSASAASVPIIPNASTQAPAAILPTVSGS